MITKHYVNFPSDWQVVLVRFERWLRLLGRSGATVRAYVAAVGRWALAGGLPGHVDQAVLLRFLYARRSQVVAATLHVELAALRAFYRCQAMHGDGGAVRWPRQRSPPRRLPHPLEVAPVLAQVAQLLDSSRFIDQRDGCLIWVVLESGMRAHECARLTTGSLLAGELHVPGLGRSVGRYVPITAELETALAAYDQARSAHQVGKSRDLWLAASGKPLRGPGAICARLRAYGCPAERLRATFAARALSTGAPLTYVAELMGHRSLASTLRHQSSEVGEYRAVVDLMRGHVSS